ncbi:MAG: DUF2752 domain-containing protein [Actinomycetota bacterium]
MTSFTVPIRPSGSRRGASITGLILGVAAVVGFVATADDDGVVICLFRRCTGGYCPGCGATRATRRLVLGDIGGAWAHHPWVVLGAAQALVIGGVVAAAARGVRTQRLRRVLARIAVPNLILLVVIWGVRLVDGSIPRPFG